eukprot:CAMPEP_0170484228 /NCGR_PEP_ID=MMETSP0208-20121228/3732_2 /TAXON_ID=197538 /ORGANISM="Strombidium inclinatum, Strain S3" /LENGTH=50 /DNA_ID=CAMNT_0010757503 /DNA_START=314 /DNA_END=466 /DNA_ORIENTATION=-
MEKYKYQVAELNYMAESNRMEMKLYTAMYLECLKLFIHFGSAIKLAFKDI